MIEDMGLWRRKRQLTRASTERSGGLSANRSTKFGNNSSRSLQKQMILGGP